MNKIFTAIIALSLAMLGGCAAVPEPSFVAANQTQVPQTVVFATVVGVRPATIRTTEPLFGAAEGGIAGAVLGSFVGGGLGRTVAAVAGGIAGMAVGSKLEAAASSTQGEMLTLRLDDGRFIAVTQAKSKIAFKKGERVELVGTNHLRVMPT